MEREQHGSVSELLPDVREEGSESCMTYKNLGIVIDDTVFDCTEYIASHPGGRAIIENFGGQDCSWQVSIPLLSSLTYASI